jgi:hypothetical protein
MTRPTMAHGQSRRPARARRTMASTPTAGSYRQPSPTITHQSTPRTTPRRAG